MTGSGFVQSQVEAEALQILPPIFPQSTVSPLHLHPSTTLETEDKLKTLKCPQFAHRHSLYAQQYLNFKYIQLECHPYTTFITQMP